MTTPYTIRMIQFLRPNGQKKNVEKKGFPEVRDEYFAMEEAGYHLQGEMLRTGEVSITISDDEEDIDISVTPNSPAVDIGIIDLLERKSWEKQRKAVS